MTTLLMLGGSDMQAHAIQRAVDMGLRVVTCDNRPDNPGHAVAHEYYEVSTTDLDGVLALARSLDIDGVLAYASDPAALTAAYVADRLGLPGDPLEAVRRAQDKLRLRAAQKEAGLPTPDFVDATDARALVVLRAHQPDGVIIKPVDASGNRGVTLVPSHASAEDASRAVVEARAQSRSRRVIAESVWGPGLHEFAGDVLVVDGAVRYLGLGRKTFTVRPDHVPSYIGVGPDQLHESSREAIRTQLQGLVHALGLQAGVYNFDLRVDESGAFSIIDFGARAGGNLLLLRHRLVDGVDLVDASIRIALGDLHISAAKAPAIDDVFMVVLRSRRDGRLLHVRLSDRLERSVYLSAMSVRPGDEVRRYRTSADRLGVLILRSGSRDLLEEIAAQPERFYTVALEGDPT